MKRLQKQIQLMERRAIRRIEPLYIRALTAQLKGDDSKAHWMEFVHALSRAHILFGLFGRSQAVHQLKISGVKIDISNPRVAAKSLDYSIASFFESLFTAPFSQAINLFRSRVPNLKKTVDQLGMEAKARAFYVSGVESSSALSKIQDRIASNLEGEREKDGRLMGQNAFVDAMDKEGLELARSRLVTVFRTNMISALNEGHAAQLHDDPGLMSAVALLRYDCIHDRRTRGNPDGLYPKKGMHWQMDGFMESPDHPIWNVIRPPNGYNCRCGVSVVGWESARRSGLASSDRKLNRSALDKQNEKQWATIRSGKFPDKGFKK